MSENNNNEENPTLGEESAPVATEVAEPVVRPRAPDEQSRISAEEEIEAAIARSSIKEQKTSTRKKRIKRGAWALLALLLGYGIYLLFVPYKGTMAFGICRVFLELNVQYPDTLRLSTVEEFGTSVRIWYTQTDSFGGYRMEPIQCFFRADETYGFVLDKVTVRRRDVDPAIVESFNKSLGTVLNYPPDLTLPYPLEDSLRKLQIDRTRFRKPIL